MNSDGQHHYGFLFSIIAVLVIILVLFVTYLFLGAPTKENFSSARMQLAFVGEYDDGLSDIKINLNTNTDANASVDINNADLEKEIKVSGFYGGNSGEAKSMIFYIEQKSKDSEQCRLIWNTNGFVECEISGLVKGISGKADVDSGEYILSCITDGGSKETSQIEICL